MNTQKQHINFNKIVYDHIEKTLEFRDKISTAGWFIVFGYFDNIEYTNYLGKGYNFDSKPVNAIVLNSDNYIEAIDLIIEEELESNNIIVSWKYDGQHLNNKEVLCVINDELQITSTNKINLKKQSFSSTQELIEELDENHFYDYFESY
jgi:hypothetical protein